ncbi:MAG: YfhO family protein, partial [Prevotella sp.]|nr:YfhO family protein [Prevotella sp.]
MWLYYPDGVYLSGSDGLFHYQRFVSVYNAVCEGRYPFFIDLDCLNGYGYATSLFYPDWLLLPFTLPIGWQGFVTAFKAMIFCSFMSCGLVAYLTIRKISKNDACAALFALLYTFSWYRLLDMSVRSAIGELWSFTFIPLVVWGVYEIVRGDYTRKWYILVVGMAGLLYCHLLSALLTTVVLSVFLLLFFRPLASEPKRLRYLLTAGLVSLLLSAAFVFPLLEQLQSNTFYFETKPPMQIEAGLNPVGRFFDSLTRHGFISDSTAHIGITLAFLFLFALILLFIYRVLRKNGDKLVKLADGAMLSSLLLLLVISDIFPWTVFPFERLCRIIQFPWRLLAFVSFFFSFAVSIYLYMGGMMIQRSVGRKYGMICRCFPVSGVALTAVLSLLSLLIVLQMKSSAASFQQG